jgi:hypothetical protein
MPFLKRLLQLNATGVVGGAGFTAYYYPELRKDPLELFRAIRRGLRVITTGAQMVNDYKLAGKNITSETHYTAATRMFDCFC